MITGFWICRSYHNETALVGDIPQAALALIFGEGVFDLHAGDGTQFGGTLDMGNDYALTLRESAPAPQGEATP
nr:hypothetical protein [uncultured Sphingomonas sp.]